MNISKVQKVRRVNTGRRLEIPVVDIFVKFFLHVAEDATLIQPDEDEMDLFKKLDRFAKSTFWSKADLLQHQGIMWKCAHVWVAHGRTDGHRENLRPDLECLRIGLSDEVC